jgi:uncharacterized damage-inducible protein DinB
MNLTLRELLDYMQEEQARWLRWFAGHGDAPLAIQLSGELHQTLGAMLQHSLGSELWFAETFRGIPLTEWWKEPATSAALFRIAAQAKQSLRQLLDEAPPEEWSRVRELQGGGRSFSVTMRKAIANALMHEVRHWAQAAIVVREHGMAPPGDHDLILSHALE